MDAVLAARICGVESLRGGGGGGGWWWLVVVMMAMVVINGKYSFIYIFEQSMSYDAPLFQL